MKQFYQCDVADSESESIWTSSVHYCASCGEAEFRVMLELQADWGDGYIPDGFIDAFGHEGQRADDPEYPGDDAWASAGYFDEIPAVTGMLPIPAATALAKLGKIAQPSADMVERAMASDNLALQLAVPAVPIEGVVAELADTERLPAAEAIAYALRNGRGAIQAMLHQIGQMSGMFGDEDGTIQDAVDAGESAETELEDAIETLKTMPAAAPGPFDIGDLLSVIGWAAQFTGDWIENGDAEGREAAALACNIVERVKAAALGQPSANETFVAVYDVGDPDDPADAEEQYYGYFGSIWQAESLYRSLAGDNPSYHNARICKVVKTLDDAPAAEPKPIRVLVAVEGGLVQGGCADVPVEVVVVDYDTDGADDDEVYAIPQDDGDTAEGRRWSEDFKANPAFIDRAVAAGLANEGNEDDD